MYHNVEIADCSESCELVCTCGESASGASWEEAGKKFDEHLREEAIYLEGEGR